MKRSRFHSFLRTSHSLFFASLTMITLGLLGLVPEVKAKNIAVLTSADISSYNQAIQAFGQNLPEGSNLVLRKYNLEGDLAKGHAIVQQILQSGVDLVLAVGLKAALVAKMDIDQVPVIFCMVLNPMKFDLRGANLTGIALEIPFQEQIRPLRTIVPTLTRIGVLYNPNKTGRALKRARGEAKKLGLDLVAHAVTSPKEVPTALREIVPQVQALWLLPDSTVLTEDSFDFLLKVTLEHNVPVVGFSSGLVQKGALVSTYIRYDDVGKQAAELAQALLNEGRSRTLNGMIAPKPLRLAINLKTANFLGLSVSPHALNRFDTRF